MSEQEWRAQSRIPKSLAMQERARARIPGMTQLLSKRPDQFSLGVWPGYYQKAMGAEVWDLDGNKYTDMSIGGIGANVLGYADADVDEAVKRAISNGSSSSLNCPEEVELADLLCDLHPWSEKARFARSGGEAMTVAVRIARAATGRDKVAFCGYHGWHDWYLAANVGTENALGEHLLTGLLPTGVPKALKGTALPFRYNQLAELDAIFAANPDQIGVVVMESIRGSPPEDGFLSKVKERAHRHGAVLVFDEISAGFRLNTGGAHLLYGVTPDIAVFSKAIGNGYPMAAIIGTAQTMEASQSTFISSTNWTERIGPVAALATIKKFRRLDVSKHLCALGQRVQDGWTSSAAEFGLKIHVGGILPMSHFSFDDARALEMKALFVQSMIERGFLASTSCYLMYAHTPEQVSQYLQHVHEVFNLIADALGRGETKALLKGQPSTAGFKRLT